MRILECLRFRIQDVDFALGTMTIRDGKGHKDRAALLPRTCAPRLEDHLVRVRNLHEQDLADGFGRVHMPTALACNYPQAAVDWRWQHVFPAGSRGTDPRTGVIRRHHLHHTEVGVQLTDESMNQGRGRSSMSDNGTTESRYCPSS